MELVASELEIREKSLYKDWGSIDPMLVINVSMEAQDVISVYLDTPWSDNSISELRDNKQIKLAHVLLACAYLYRDKAVEATEDKVTEEVGPLSETATDRNLDFLKLYERWEAMAWKHLMAYINTDEPPVSNPDLLSKMLPTYIERHPRAYAGTVSGVASGSSIVGRDAQRVVSDGDVNMV